MVTVAGPRNAGAVVSAGVRAYIGGERAENWLTAVVSKLSNNQEQAYKLTKRGELDPLEFNKKERKRDQQLYSSILDSLLHKNAAPEREATMIFKRIAYATHPVTRAPPVVS